MSKQLQIIAVSNILGPLDERVVMHLKSMMMDTKKNWFALYLTLHICALVTKRDEEYARQISLSVSYNDPSVINRTLTYLDTILSRCPSIIEASLHFY